MDAGLPRFRDDLDARPRRGRRQAGRRRGRGAHPLGLRPHRPGARPPRGRGARILIHRGDEATPRQAGPEEGRREPDPPPAPAPAPGLLALHDLHDARGRGEAGRRSRAPRPSAAATCSTCPGSPKVVETFGHTAGHSALLLEGQGVLFVGDELCTWNPLTGVRKPQLMPRQFNESNEACRESLAAVEATGAQVVLAGPRRAVDRGRRGRGGVRARVAEELGGGAREQALAQERHVVRRRARSSAMKSVEQLGEAVRDRRAAGSGRSPRTPRAGSPARAACAAWPCSTGMIGSRSPQTIRNGTCSAR